MEIFLGEEKITITGDKNYNKLENLETILAFLEEYKNTLTKDKNKEEMLVR